jgi:hypothetical protein
VRGPHTSDPADPVPSYLRPCIPCESYLRPCRPFEVQSRELIFEVGGWSFGVRERVCYIFGGRWWRIFSHVTDSTATDSLKASSRKNDSARGSVYWGCDYATTSWVMLRSKTKLRQRVRLPAWSSSAGALRIPPDAKVKPSTKLSISVTKSRQASYCSSNSSSWTTSAEAMVLLSILKNKCTIFRHDEISNLLTAKRGFPAFMGVWDSSPETPRRRWRAWHWWRGCLFARDSLARRAF